MSKKPVLMPKAERREAALQVAIKLAKKVGARRVSMAMVAAVQKVSPPLLFHIFESREGLCKAILRQAKKEGVTLPDPMPTVREQRAATRKVTKLKKLKAPAKRAVPVKLAKLKKPATAKKLAALLSPKVNKLGKVAPRKRSIKEVKAIKDKLAATIVVKAIDKSRAKLLKQPKVSTPEPARKRPVLTPAQKTAKAARDKARRTPAVPLSPAAKFASLPAPFEAAVQQVAA